MQRGGPGRDLNPSDTRGARAQVSAVQKIARVMPIPPGLPLYRGLGGTVSLPRSFYKTDENLCRGFSEWGFMSTSADRQALLLAPSPRLTTPFLAIFCCTVHRLPCPRPPLSPIRAPPVGDQDSAAQSPPCVRQGNPAPRLGFAA